MVAGYLAPVLDLGKSYLAADAQKDAAKEATKQAALQAKHDAYLAKQNAATGGSTKKTLIVVGALLVVGVVSMFLLKRK